MTSRYKHMKYESVQEADLRECGSTVWPHSHDTHSLQDVWTHQHLQATSATPSRQFESHEDATKGFERCSQKMRTYSTCAYVIRCCLQIMSCSKYVPSYVEDWIRQMEFRSYEILVWLLTTIKPYWEHPLNASALWTKNHQIICIHQVIDNVQLFNSFDSSSILKRAGTV